MRKGESLLSNFADRLMAAIEEKNSRVCVGIDIYPDRLPAAAYDPVEFARAIIEATHDVAVAFKLQMAFFEQLGLAMAEQALTAISATARATGALVIVDAKRNDIASTAKAYAAAYLGGRWDIDALTVNPYFGSDGVQPFVDEAQRNDRGIFVLVKTSNASSQEIQDLEVKADGETMMLYEHVGRLVAKWGRPLRGQSGYSSVGAVVGATFPEQARRLRRIMPHTPLLVPGYGAQGATAEDVKGCFDEKGLGVIVNSSRGILYAYQSERYRGKPFDEAARAAAQHMRDEINDVLLTEH